MSNSASEKVNSLSHAIAAARRADKLKWGCVDEGRVITAFVDTASDVWLAEIEADPQKYGPAWQRAVAARKFWPRKIAADRKEPPAKPHDLGAAAVAEAPVEPPADPLGGVALIPTDSLADLATRIMAEHEAVGVSARQTLHHAINAGRLLIEAKKLVEHGCWGDWLRRHCDVSERTVQNYMRLARHQAALEVNPQTTADLTMDDALKALARTKPDALDVESLSGRLTKLPSAAGRACRLADEHEVHPAIRRIACIALANALECVSVDLNPELFCAFRQLLTRLENGEPISALLPHDLSRAARFPIPQYAADPGDGIPPLLRRPRTTGAANG